MTEEYRSYNEIVPEFLRSRPRPVIIHCLHRIRKGKRFKNSDIKALEGEGLFTVQSMSSTVHSVDFGLSTGNPSCTCKDWIRFNIPCKHFFAIFEHQAKWCWDSLPDVYLQSPHLNCDKQALDSFYENNPDNDMPTEKGRDDVLPSSQSNHVLESCENLLPPKVSYIICCIIYCYNYLLHNRKGQIVQKVCN